MPPAQRYKTACARTIGRAHQSAQTPCQDFVASRQGRDLACVALADGAGSCAHSEHGAEAAVRATIRFVSTHFERLWAQAQQDATAVAQELTDYCLTALQREAKRLHCALPELACTLLFVAHQEGRYLAGHLGDGCIARMDEDGHVFPLSHPDNGEFANTTRFLTDASAVRHFRIFHSHDPKPSGFVLMSDGTAESLYLKASRSLASGAIQKLLAWNVSLPKAKMEAILTSNLEQAFTRKTRDDCSIALLSNLQAVQADESSPADASH